MIADSNKLNSEVAKDAAQPDVSAQRVYVDATEAILGRGEIALLFGKIQSCQHMEIEIEAQLTDRILLSPTAAEKLSVLLNDAILVYERKFGKLNCEGNPGGTVAE